MSEPRPDRARPVLLTVDDDPAVSRAVARDLRRRYGEEYRIVRASSGAEALEALREIRLRGDRVAAILADYRMPQMNGIELLEAAMDLFPRAARALLTAYADTDAAISAINVVDVDYYLLKPWDPPEEKLYPVVDALILGWQASGERAVPEVKVVGHPYSLASHEVRDFLARNAVPYRWYNESDAEAVRLIESAGLTGVPDVIPLVVTVDGEALPAPSIAELAGKVGLATTPSEDFYDVVIVGGGPAGLGAAVYAASEGLRTVLVERQATGGQAGQSSRIENYLGFPDGVSGSQLTDRARRQAARFGAEVLTARAITGLRPRGTAGSSPSTTAVPSPRTRSCWPPASPTAGCRRRTPTASWAGGCTTGRRPPRRRPARTCTSSAARTPPGRRRCSSPATPAASPCSSAATRWSDPCRTTSSSRSPGWTGSASVPAARSWPATATSGSNGSPCATCRSGATEDLTTGHVFVFIGASPMTEWLDGVVILDRQGFVMTGPALLTDGRRPVGWPLDRDPLYLEASLPGVFVAGDVRSQSVKRIASAVGEGAMAVTLVHGYLEHR